MTDWIKLAAAVDPPVPEEAATAISPGLAKLEAHLAPLDANLPIDTLPWTAPVE